MMDGIHILGIRHRGPGSARSVVAALEVIQPQVLLVEATRLAETAAVLRGCAVPGLAEFNDAAQAVFCFGDSAPMALIRERLIVGDVLGGVPSEVPQVPLQRDFQKETKRLRLPPEALDRTLELDLRKPNDLDRSRLLRVEWGKPEAACAGRRVDRGISRRERPCAAAPGAALESARWLAHASGRCMMVWYDSDGKRQRRSRATLKEADELVREVSEALKEKVNGAMTLDDRQAYNLAREIAEPLGYTVLQAIRERERTKAPYRGKKTTDVIAELIAELIAAKRREQLSVPYVNRLEDDLKSFVAAVPSPGGNRESSCAGHQSLP